MLPDIWRYISTFLDTKSFCCTYVTCKELGRVLRDYHKQRKDEYIYQRHLAICKQDARSLWNHTWVGHNPEMIYATEAGKHGFIDVIQRNPTWFRYLNKIAQEAARYGQLDLLKFLYGSQQRKCTYHLKEGVKRNFHSKDDTKKGEAICFLDAIDTCSGFAITYACESGRIDIVKWFYSVTPECFDSCDIDQAAKHGHFELVKWLARNTKSKCSKAAITYSVEHGHYEIAKWLHDRFKSGCYYNTINVAIEANRLDIAKWLHENVMQKCTLHAFFATITTGNIEALQWLFENYRHVLTMNAMIELRKVSMKNGNAAVVAWCNNKIPEVTNNKPLTRPLKKQKL